MYQFAGPNVATPNARVAHAFSAMPLNVTVLANLSAAFPAPAAEAKADTRPSANEIVAAEFRDAAPQSVMPSDDTSSPRQVRMLVANASLDAVPVDNEAMLRLDGPPAASPNLDQRELSYLKYYVYSEIPPPEKPAKIALAALRNVPLGTPVQEIERAADAFDLDLNFMKAVGQNRIRLQSEEPHRLLYRTIPAEQV